MYLDLFPLSTPQPIGTFHDLTIFAEGPGFFPPRVRSMLLEDDDRFSDLCGRTAALVIPLLDWSGRRLPFCVTACQGDLVVAAAWAGSISSKDNGTIGCNLSFGLHPSVAGRGLATVLSALAYQQCLASTPMMEFVNVQTEAGNYRAQAVAQRLQLSRAPMFDRNVPGSESRRYVTYRAEAEVVTARCTQILSDSMLTVRAQDKPVQPRVELRPTMRRLPHPFLGSPMPLPTNPHSHGSVEKDFAATIKILRDNVTLRTALDGPHGLLAGIALIEEKLEIAKRRLPGDVPFPLVGREADLYHEASYNAYSHSLEMISSQCLREMHDKLGAVPLRDDEVCKQNLMIAIALFGEYGVTSGAAIIEKCLQTATRGSHLDSPVPLSPEEGKTWHRAQQSAYQYALEMLCTGSLQRIETQFLALVHVEAPVDVDAPAAPAM